MQECGQFKLWFENFCNSIQMFWKELKNEFKISETSNKYAELLWSLVT